MANHAETDSKPIYKKWWFWVIVVIVVVAIYSSDSSNNNIETSANISSESISESNSEVNKEKVTVIDFSKMDEKEIQDWCTDNNVIYETTEDYSDTVKKGSFINQSAKANSTIYEGDTITITYSLGKEPSTEEKNALKKAESYSSTLHMSKAKIYDQLTSEYGEAFSAEAAQYAIDNMEADWNANALAKAKSYQTNLNMSKQKIYEQLISEYGEEFTEEQAQYAIDHLDD